MLANKMQLQRVQAQRPMGGESVRVGVVVPGTVFSPPLTLTPPPLSCDNVSLTRSSWRGTRPPATR